MKSGFGGFNKLSSAITGKRITVDSYGLLDRAIKTIIGDEQAIIFTTAVPRSISVDNNGLLHQWKPLNYPVDIIFSQSVNTNKPILSSVYPLGKYPSVYFSGVGQRLLTTINFKNFEQVFTPVTNYFLYNNYVAYPTVTATTNFLIFGSVTAPLSLAHSPGLIYDNVSNFVQYRHSINYGGVNKIAALNFDTSSAPALFGSNANTFRMIEQIYTSNTRTVTSSFYDENKSLINVTPSSSSPLTASSNLSSFTFSSSSVGVTAANWDTQFPLNSNGPPAYAQIGASTGNHKMAFHVLVKCSTNSAISTNAVQDLKNLLDKVYGT